MNYRQISHKSSILATLAVGLISFGLPCTAQDWIEIETADRPITIQTSGVVTSDDVLHFSTPATRSWNLSIASIAPEGKRVNPGDLLVRFESSYMTRRLREYENSLASARSELTALIEAQAEAVETEKLQLAEAKSQAQKSARKASQPADLIPSVEYAKLVIQKETDEKLLRQLEKRQPASDRQRQAHRTAEEVAVTRAEKRLEAAQDDLSKFVAFAPRSGVVRVGVDMMNEKLDVDSGVHPGMVVVYLMDDSKLSVKGDVPEQLATRIAVGQSATVTFESLGGIEIRGQLTSVGQTVRRKSRDSLAMVREFHIKLNMDEIPDSIKVGASAQVTIDTGVQQDAIAVPTSALVYRNGSPGVISRDGWQQIRLGPTSGGQRIVLDGLSAGDEVQL